MNRRSSRMLWRVTKGWYDGPSIDPSSICRPESKVKAFDIYVPNAIGARTGHDFVDVWVDMRDGAGWQLYKRIDRNEYSAWAR